MRPRVADSILELVGNTPMVALNHTIDTPKKGRIYAKLEYMNPGQSSKDRAAISMIEEAEKSGELKPGGTIIEGTSGNTGFALAMIAIQKGYRCIFTINDKQSKEKIDILRAFGARVIVCPTAVFPEHPNSYYSVARKIHKETPNSIYINQYDNLANRKAHYQTTGPEIWEQTRGNITHFFAGMGTGGTISGVAKFLKEQNSSIQIIGIDCKGSVYTKYFYHGIFDRKAIHPYLVEGIGEDIIPRNMDFSLIDDVIQISDSECFSMTRKLLKEEALFVGGSSGAVIAGVSAYLIKRKTNNPICAVALLPDSGSRYISKIFNDQWMKDNFFKVN